MKDDSVTAAGPVARRALCTAVRDISPLDAAHLPARTASSSARLATLFQERAARLSPGEFLDVVEGGSAVHARITGIAAAARVETLSLETPVRVSITRQERREVDAVETGLVKRGLRVSTIMSEELTGHVYENEARSLAASRLATLRHSTQVPLRLLVFDRRIALLPVDPADTRRGAYITNAASLVSLACILFDDLWQRSPLMPELLDEPDNSDRPQEQARRVIDLLAAGQTDARIARTLGISPRTVMRVVRQLSNELGATSRFQLALRLQQEGRVVLRPTAPLDPDTGNQPAPPTPQPR